MGAARTAAAADPRPRPTLRALPEPGPGGNPLTAYKYPSLSAAKKRAKGLVENVQFTIRVPPEGGDAVVGRRRARTRCATWPRRSATRRCRRSPTSRCRPTS